MHRIKKTAIALVPIAGLSVALLQGCASERALSAQGYATPGYGSPVTTGTVVTPTDRMEMSDIRASKLIGQNIRDVGNRTVGEVRDLIVDANNGTVQYAVVAYDAGTLRSDRLYAVPLTQLRWSGRNALTWDIDRDRLANAPGFTSERWPTWTDPTYRSEVDRYYQTPAGPQVMPNARLVRMSDLLRADVRSVDNRDIGDVKDVVVDMSTGRVRYAVVEFERGFLRSDKLVALPFNAFRPVSDGRDLIVVADPAQLENAPSFTRSDWPENDRAFDRRVQDYRYDPAYRGGSPSSRTDPYYRQ